MKTNNKVKSTLLFLFFIFCMNLSAQNENEIYLQNEKARLKKASYNEDKVDAFIRKNINSFNLKEEIINEISYEYLEDGATKKLNAKEIEFLINEIKKEELRKLYFSKHPETQNLYKSLSQKGEISCVNGGFESGIEGYSFYKAKYAPNYTAYEYLWTIFENFPSYFEFPANTSIIPSSTQRITRVDNSILDPITNLPRVNSGNYSIRLNNTTANMSEAVGQNPYHTATGFGYVSEMTRTFVITDTKLTFSYAMVVQNPTHEDVEIHSISGNDQPYFQYRIVVKNSEGEITSIPFEKHIKADNTLDMFLEKRHQNIDLLYTNWRCESINTSSLIGQEVTLEFYMSDCGKGAHFGYVYIDDICGPCSLIENTIDLDPKEINCPDFPINISGTMNNPQNLTLTNLTLNISDENGNIINSIPVPLSSLVGNVFSYNLLPSDFIYPISTSGYYTITLTAEFSNDTSITSSSLVKISFIDCCYATPGNNDSTNRKCETNKTSSLIKNKNSENTILVEKTKKNTIKIFPNPTNGNFSINFEEMKTGKIDILNLSGDLLTTKKITQADTIDFNINNMKKGIYIIKFSNEYENISDKLIIE